MVIAVWFYFYLDTPFDAFAYVVAPAGHNAIIHTGSIPIYAFPYWFNFGNSKTSKAFKRLHSGADHSDDYAEAGGEAPSAGVIVRTNASNI